MNSLFGKLSSRVHLFFLVFGISLFLGDGRQTGIDLYWAVVTIATTHQWKSQKNRFALPRILLVAGFMFLTASLVSTFFSWSPGYSISAFMRIIVAVIWLIRFSSITKEEITTLMNDCTLLALFFAPVTVLALLLPSATAKLPALNLIALPSGHLPISYVALAFLPIVFVASQKNTYARWALISTLISIFASFSRASIALMAIFFFFMFRSRMKQSGRLIVFLSTAGMFAVVFALFLWIMVPPSPREYTLIPEALRVYLNKNSLLTDPRTEYIRQSLQAFWSSPIIGTGPGTFALISKQFASSSVLMSSYAHNAWIQALGEYGLLGMVVLGAIAIYYLWLWYRNKNTPEIVFSHAFWQSALLTILLSVFEQSLDRYSIAVFFAMCLGIVLTLTHRPNRTITVKVLPFTLLAIFYATSWIASDIAMVFQKPALAYLLAPYHKVKAIDLASTSQEQQTYILRFFPHDPEIDVALARGSKNIQGRIPWYQKAIRESPNDPFIERNYLSVVSATGDTAALCQEFFRYSNIEEFNCADEPLFSFMKSGQFRELLPILGSDNGPAKFFYSMGLNFLTNSYGEQLTITLWARARDADPNWGYYHAELASLVVQHNNSLQTAVPTLLTCLTNPFARSFCQYYLDDLSRLPPPGAFGKKIFAIPAVIDTNHE